MAGMHKPLLGAVAALGLYLTTGIGAMHALTTSIAEHGAVADGKTMNTAAIQAAVEACAQAGGGTVVVPAGAWLTGSVQLKSNVTLQLDNGAMLRASPNLADYTPIAFKHPEMPQTTSLLWAMNQHDIVVRGEGEIELADEPFFDWNKLWTGLPAAEDAKLADWQRAQCVVAPKERPTQPVFFHQCRRVKFEGVTVSHSPCWTLVFSGCDGVRLHGIRIENNLRIPNNDGVHFTGTSNVVVSDCVIHAGDDALAVSAITVPGARCENYVYTNCLLTSRSTAIRFGYQGAKVRNVTVSNVVIRDSQRGIFLNAGNDGCVENVAITNVTMETKMFAGGWWGKGEPLVIAAPETKTGRIRGVTISHVRATAENSIVLVGQNRNVRDITLEDWEVAYGYSANSPLYGRAVDVAPAAPRGSAITPERLPWLYAESVEGLRLVNVRHRLQDGQAAMLSLEPVLTDVDSSE